MARPNNLDQIIFDKVQSNVAETPAADHIAQIPPGETATPPGLNIAPPTTEVVDQFTGHSFPELPENVFDHGNPPGWLLP
jgi:hypothetical protein